MSWKSCSVASCCADRRGAPTPTILTPAGSEFALLLIDDVEGQRRQRRNRSRWPAPRGHHHAIHQCLVTERNPLQASGAERERIGRFTETYRGVCAIEYSAYPRGTDSRATSRDSWGLFCN